MVVKAIFFDFNGVIIDDERIHLRAYREVLLDKSVPLTDEDYFASLGMDDKAFVQAAYARAGQSLSEEVMHLLIKREHELHREFITNEFPVSTAVITFIKAAARRYQLGIVSMAERSEIDFVLGVAGLTDPFSIIVSAEPGLRHKPAPDCYQRGLDMLNEKRRGARELPLTAKECLAIEDAPPGIEAARGAGMRTLGITTTVSAEQLRAAGAEVVTASLADWTVDAVHHLFA
ncbi:MAG: HAD family phosphatase [Acidobacteriota bacterium]